MLLGIVLHTALAYTPINWIVQDIHRPALFGFLTAAIHGFRMPLFFMMSGFFTAMLWRKRGLRALLIHRVRRILLPLLLGMATIVPILNVIYGYPLYTPDLHHLWFLWHLCWLVAGFAAFVLISRRVRLPRLPERLVLSPARYLWLIPLTMIPTAMMGSFGPDTSAKLVPTAHVLGYYAIFFGFGALYYEYNDPDVEIGRWWWLVLPANILIVFPLGLTLDPEVLGIPRVLPVFFQTVYPWLMLFGLTGLFARIFGRHSFAIRYISDSSYWLYLVHLPLILLAQRMVRLWQLPAVIKFGLICALVTTLLLVTYQAFVRYSWLGTMLNGPRQRARGAVIKATE